MKLFSPIISGSVSMSAGSTLFGTASQALTASFIPSTFFSGTNAVESASFASTASFAFNVPNIYITTGSNASAQAISGSLTISGSTLTARNGLAASGTIDLSGSITIVNGVTVSAGGATEFQVTSTGVKIGNIDSDIHTVTGSLRASGSSHIIIGTTTVSGAFTHTPVRSGEIAYVTFASGSILRGDINTRYNPNVSSIIISASLVPLVAQPSGAGAGRTSSFDLGSPSASWKKLWVSTRSIHFVDDDANELNILSAADSIPKDPLDPTKGFWFPINSFGSQTVVGDFNVYRVPATFQGTNGDQYSPVRKNTRTGIGYQSLYNATQLGDADAAIKGGLGVTINNWNESVVFSLNVSGAGYTRPDLSIGPLTASGLFQTDVTFPFSSVGDTTASLIIPTSSLIDVINGTYSLILKGNSTFDQPELAYNNSAAIAFRISGSSIPYNNYWQYEYPSYYLGGRQIPTFYAIASLPTSESKFSNFVNTINEAVAYMNSASLPFGQLAMTASISASNLVLRTTKSGSFANNYFAWTPTFTDSLPLFFEGGHTATPGLPFFGKILFNDSQDTGLYKYGMGIRVLSYTETGVKPAPYVELGDFNHINNKTRLVIDDRYNYLHISASSISIGISGSTTNIGNNAITNIGLAENSTINIATAETEATTITIGSTRNQGRNRFFGNASTADNGGVTQIVAGNNISISPTNGKGAVTITSTGGGGSGTGSLGANISSSFVSSSAWSFTHNLGNRGVIVQTFDDNWNQIIPQSLTLTNANTVTINFPGLQSGYAIASLGGNINTSVLATTGSNIFKGNQTITGSLLVTGSTTIIGTLTATTIVAQTITSSTDFVTGSTRFGSIISNTHQFIGSVSISGSLSATSSWATNAVTSSYAQTLAIQSTLTDYISTTTSTGVNTLFTLTTSSYNSAFGKYTILNGLNARAGEFVTVWNSGSITYYDNSTTDIGSTSNVVFSASFSGANVLLQASASIGWTIKMLTTYI